VQTTRQLQQPTLLKKESGERGRELRAAAQMRRWKWEVYGIHRHTPRVTVTHE
jgi:hypothetical protein